MIPTPNQVFKEVVQAPLFTKLHVELRDPYASKRPTEDTVRDLIEFTARIAGQMVQLPPDRSSKDITEKLEFWEKCFIAVLPSVNGSVLSADRIATDALLKRQNLIALLKEKPE